MIWAAPAVWALAILAALPLVAHLWSRKRPAALQFPTLRFLRAASPVSRRLRRVQDWPLLLLRLMIVGVICAAAAGPTLAARWRQDAWRMQLHRVIVVDADVASARASAAVSDLQKDAASTTVLGPAAVTDILDEAIAQADRSAGTHRTELAVVWSGSRDGLTVTDVSSIPTRVGVRLVPVADVARSSPGVAMDAATADVVIQTDDAELRDVLESDLKALILPPLSTPIRLRWHADSDAHRRQPPADCRGARAPVLRALDEMLADVRLQEAADRSVRTGISAANVSADATATVLARSADGKVLLRGWADDGCLVLDLDAEPRSPLTWWALVSAREAVARLDRSATPDRWSAADVARANRDGLAPTDASLPGGLDTRAAWGVALALLLAEQAWRQRGSSSREREASAAIQADAQEPVDAA